VDIQTGKLEWIVNGYQTFATISDKWNDVVKSAGETVDKLKSLADFKIGEMKFPETKIGETMTQATDWLSQKVENLKLQPIEAPPTETAPPPPSTAATIATKFVEIAGKHWPQTPTSEAPPSPPKKIPIPPPIRPKSISRQGKH
jgi:hypothetical protein